MTSQADLYATAHLIPELKELFERIIMKSSVKLLLAILVLLTAIPLHAKEASPEQLTRRLFLDLFQRLPTVKEYNHATEMIKAGKYENLVNSMMTDEEYFMTLSAQMYV